MRRWSAWLALVPALTILAVVFGTSGFYALSQSFGWLPIIGKREFSTAAYENLLVGAQSRSFWPALGFSLWVSGAATLLSALLALLVTAGLGQRLRTNQRILTLLNLNLSFPHLVWAITMLLLLAQSGLLARLAAALGLIARPVEFPVLVRDRAGVGIIVAYVFKEVPFLLLVIVSILRSQATQLADVAATLGANRWQRLRWVTWPLVAPGLLGSSLLVFAFIFGAYEVPALLGVTFPEMIAVLALDFFRSPDLNARTEAMALSVMMAVVVLMIVAVAQRWRRQEP